MKAKEAARLSQDNWDVEPKPEMTMILEQIEEAAKQGLTRIQIAVSLTPYQADYLRGLGYYVSLKMYNQYFEVSWFHHIPEDFLESSEVLLAANLEP